MISFEQDEFIGQEWHLLLCKPNQSRIAFQNLQRMGFDLFMPRHAVERPWRGTVKSELRPVFGGYMFISARPDCLGWHKVRNTPGVSSLIGFGSDGPAVVPSDVVAGLMGRCDHEGLLQPYNEKFAVGDKIKIAQGPFAEFVATVERIGADQRLYILLDFLGRPTKIDVDPARVVRPA